MSRKQKFCLVLLGAIGLASCQKDVPTPVPQPRQQKEINKKPQDPQQPKQDPQGDEQVFPKPDNALALQGYPAERLLTLLLRTKLTEVLPLGETTITPKELDEIRTFTEELIKDKKAHTQREKHDVIFRWIVQTVKYGKKPWIPQYNSAYSTFKHHDAICQGYSNLLKVMCYTQGINAPVVNGLANFANAAGTPLGHAWNYTNLDGNWYVSDATNNVFYEAKDPKRFNFLLPERLDFVLWQDETISYVFENNELTVGTVHKSSRGNRLIVPYSVSGIQISNFNPVKMPSDISEIYLGANIRSLGTPDNRRLNREAGRHIEVIAIDPNNSYLENYKGSIYEKRQGANEPIVIPARLKCIELKPNKVIGKNMVYRHDGVTELHFAEGTEAIEAYAVEECRSLRTIYLPKSIQKVDPKAFVGCHPDLKIINL